MDLRPSHRRPGPPISVQEAWAALPPDLGAVWLQDGQTGEALLAAADLCLASHWIHGAWQTKLDGAPWPGSPWDALAEALRASAHPWIGAATYELACDEAGHPRKPLPEGTLGQCWIRPAWALHWGPGGVEAWSWGAEPCLPALPPGPAARPKGRVDGLVPAWSEGQHQAAVAGIQEAILSGRFYVANLCVPFASRFEGDPLALAEAVLGQAAPPFGALLRWKDRHLLSLSMERLLGRRGDRLWSEPIKGSAPLIGCADQDAEAARALAADPKERAEHTMILDLIRNDLGRVAQSGSVRVSEAMALRAYPTVQHLVSTVEARAQAGLGLADLLRAVLPGGSVTGAPKHAVCGHLAAVEAAPRGFYCGALGWVAPWGDLDLALPIRTAQVQGDALTYWAGGGITRRSDPAREWAELALKTRALTL